jgi:hypothetical protein
VTKTTAAVLMTACDDDDNGENDCVLVASLALSHLIDDNSNDGAQ